MGLGTFIGKGKMINKLREAGYIMRPIHSFSHLNADYEFVSRIRCPRIHVLVKNNNCYAHIDKLGKDGEHIATMFKHEASFNCTFKQPVFFDKAKRLLVN